MSILFEIIDGAVKLRVPKTCIGNVRPERYLGGGSTGEVVSVCLNGGQECTFIAKVIDTEGSDYDEDRFNVEIAMTQIASQLDIGPKYIRHTECNVDIEGEDDPREFKFIITEKYDITLGDYLEKLDDLSEKEIDAFIRVLIELVVKSYKYLFLHGDLFYKKGDINEGNLMLKLDKHGMPIKAVLIDFEYSKLPAEQKKVRTEWCGFINSLISEYPALEKLTNEEFLKECI